MSLTISDTILDEEFRATQTGTSDDNDVTAATYNASAFKTAVDALSLTFFTSPTGFPQHAENQDFVSSSNDPVVTNYFLASDSSGDAFPASGTATDLYVGSNQIFLFATANSDIIVGRVGSGETADPNGAVVLVIGVEETRSGGFVTQADMWLSLYAPVVQDGHNLVDSADSLDLSNLVYLGSTFDTTTEVPFENFDGVPSGNNLFNVIFPSGGSTDVQLLLTGSEGSALSTVNVSSTGIGAGSQHIDVGATLRIDTVTGMVQDNVNDAPEVNDSANIDYTNRVDLVAADFEVTQLNPGSTSERVDIKVSAFNVAGTAQEQSYVTGINSNGTAVQIDAADVKVLNGAGQDITSSLTILQDGDSVIIRGLDDGTSSSKTDGYQVFFTTDGVHFDRFLITNVDGDDSTLDIGNIHVTAVQGGVDTEFSELGSSLVYEDDGPNIDPTGNTVPTVTDDDSAFGTDNSSSFAGLFTTPDYGADASGTLSYILGVKSANADSGLDDTLTGQNVVLSYDSATNTVYGKTATSGLEVFKITVDSSGHVTLDQSRAVVHGDTGSVDENSSSIASDLITLTAKVVDSEGATGDSDSAAVNIGSAFLFKDDGPSMTGQASGSLTPNNLQVDNDRADSADSMDSSAFTLTAGADGQKSFTIVGPADSSGDFTWQYFDVDGVNGVEANEIKGFYKGTALYTLELQDDGSYAFKMIGDLPGKQIDLSTAEIKAGGPDTNSIIVGALNSDDYVVMSGGSTVGAGNINESHGFVGVDNGNVDANETLVFTLFDGNDDPIYFQSIMIGTKSAQASDYHYVAHLVGGGTASGDLAVGKNGILNINPPGDALIESIEITKMDGSATKIGIGDIHFVIPPDDVQLGFTVELKDGDNDAVTSSFTVDIDGNNDGSFDAAVNSLALPMTSTSSSLLLEPEHHELLTADHLITL